MTPGNPSSSGRRLIVVTGQEGAGKTTVMRALLESTPGAAKVDAEDVGQVNPFVMDDRFLALLHANVLAVVRNFWAAGHDPVITGSLLAADRPEAVEQVRRRLPGDVRLGLVHLLASTETRDRRRIARAKPSTEESRAAADRHAPEDGSLAAVPPSERGYDYLRIRNDEQTVAETIAAIRAGLADFFAVDGAAPQLHG